MSPESRTEYEKELAGRRAAEAVLPGMTLGLGTGSTVAHFLNALARRFEDGELPGIVGVPTSVHTENEAGALGLPLTTLEDAGSLDLTVDGADEVDPNLNLIKGMGGALLREKMVAQASERLLIIVDEGKVVGRLGTRSPLPVEVVEFGWRSHVPFLRSMGAEVEPRRDSTGDLLHTDNGNLILDCAFGEGIPDPGLLDAALASRAGVVETGLFLGMAQEVLIGGGGGVRSVTR